MHPLCDQGVSIFGPGQAVAAQRASLWDCHRGRLSGREVEEMCRTIRRVRRETETSLCASLWPFEEEE